MNNNNFFGTTETADPCFDFSWVNNLYDGNIIITKRLTDKLIETLILPEVQHKVILHLTVTGMGNSKLEPFVPTKETNFIKLQQLLAKGFPIEQVVLRIDPIIPTKKGVETAISVIDLFCSEIPIKRIRISFMDMYKHVKERLVENGIKIPYDTFHAPQNLINDCLLILIHKKVIFGFELESCTEKVDKMWADKIDMCGCVSQKDVDILGIQDKITLIGIGDGKQRKNCSCPSNKKQILSCKPQHCQHQCVYCFWKNQ